MLSLQTLDSFRDIYKKSITPPLSRSLQPGFHDSKFSRWLCRRESRETFHALWLDNVFFACVSWCDFQHLAGFFTCADEATCFCADCKISVQKRTIWFSRISYLNCALRNGHGAVFSFSAYSRRVLSRCEHNPRFLISFLFLFLFLQHYACFHSTNALLLFTS